MPPLDLQHSYLGSIASTVSKVDIGMMRYLPETTGEAEGIFEANSTGILVFQSNLPVMMSILYTIKSESIKKIYFPPSLSNTGAFLSRAVVWNFQYEQPLSRLSACNISVSGSKTNPPITIG